MLSAILSWVFIGLQVLCGIGIPWYLDLYTPHSAGYHPWIYGGLLVAGALAQAWDKISVLAKNRILETQVVTLQGNLGQIQSQTGEFAFLKYYTETLSSAVDLLQDLNSYHLSHVKFAQRKILDYIASVVEIYFKEKVALEVNASLMEPRSPRDFAVGKYLDSKRVYFSDQSRSFEEYRAVLVITAWAKNASGVPRDFALPVDSDDERLLFGAARAFASGDETVIPDVKDVGLLQALLEGQPPAVKREVLDFFARQQYVSFVSLPVEFAGQVIAVLNIQSSRPSIFGENEHHAADIKRFILPFRSILAILLWRESVLAKEQQRAHLSPAT